MIRITPVILCGGSGTRLWPLSTSQKPKPFLSLISNKSLLLETAERFTKSRNANIEFHTPMVIGSVRHCQQISDTLPEARIVLEPIGRNSAPAIAVASLLSKSDELLLILPADHCVDDVQAFHDAVASGVAYAVDDEIVTFGIKPDHASSDYGYIKQPTPQTLCDGSTHLWKSQNGS